MTDREEEGLDAIDRIAAADPRYRREAYLFVVAAVEHVVRGLDAPRHVTGQELLEGIRQIALDRFGIMAKTVFEHWGVRTTEDFGHIVFHLVGAGLLSKTEEDSIRDFQAVYEFHDVFGERFPWVRSDWEV